MKSACPVRKKHRTFGISECCAFFSNGVKLNACIYIVETKQDALWRGVFPVLLAIGSHLIPSRTQQLSLSAPMVAARQE